MASLGDSRSLPSSMPSTSTSGLVLITFLVNTYLVFLPTLLNVCCSLHLCSLCQLRSDSATPLLFFTHFDPLTHILAYLLCHQEASRSSVLRRWALCPSPFLLVSRLDYRPSCHQRLRCLRCRRFVQTSGCLDRRLCFPCPVLSLTVHVVNINWHWPFSASSSKALLPLTPSLRQKATFRRLSPLLGHFGPYLTTKRRASSTGPPSSSPSWPSSGSSKGQ